MAKITDYIIVLPENPTENERRAASFIRENVKLVCGKKLKMVSDACEPVANEIVVGQTTRELIDNVTFNRYRDTSTGGIWEYVIKKVGGRLYLTGLGHEPAEELPFTTSYRHLDDGKIGTVMAAYHFVEDILGYDFIYNTYIDFPENPDICMPEEYNYEFTREVLRKKDPVLYEGAAFYGLHGCEDLHCNTCGMIFKSRSGKIIVVDGGRPAETDRFLRVLKKISGKEIPHIDAWLFSHLHVDHYGVYYKLCSDEKYSGAVTVDRFYNHLLPEEFYTSLSKERIANAPAILSAMLSDNSPTGAKSVTVKVGDVIKVDELDFEVLHIPDIADAPDMNMNNSSVVYKMTYDGNQTMLLLADAEWICSNDLVENCAGKLKSDIVQVGHHGCGNVSEKCYEMIDADAYIWLLGEKFWYSDCGEGLNTHNTGVIRSRAYMMRNDPKIENIHIAMDDIISLPLPIKIH